MTREEFDGMYNDAITEPTWDHGLFLHANLTNKLLFEILEAVKAQGKLIDHSGNGHHLELHDDTPPGTKEPTVTISREQFEAAWDHNTPSEWVGAPGSPMFRTIAKALGFPEGQK